MSSLVFLEVQLIGEKISELLLQPSASRLSLMDSPHRIEAQKDIITHLGLMR